MKIKGVVYCSKCREAINSGESFGFVCYKIPGKEGYLFFHRRFPGDDCWEVYLKEGKAK